MNGLRRCAGCNCNALVAYKPGFDICENCGEVRPASMALVQPIAVQRAVISLTVRWRPPQPGGGDCPSCGEKSCKVTSSPKASGGTRERWHRCPKCGTKFRSIETGVESAPPAVKPRARV